MDQQYETMKARPLNKDQVMLLLNFISNEKIITTKATNATNNRLKDQAWKSIAENFSAHIGENRRPEQLRLKWENLKKAARKRSAAIRQNNLKTGGGKTHIASDDVLDSVASMLGATCGGYTVEFGGDGENINLNLIEDISIVLPQESLPDVNEENDAEKNVDCGGGDGKTINYIPKTVLFNTPKNSQNKRRKLNEELLRSQIEKELALAAYLRAKTVKIELENARLSHDNE